MCIMGDERIIDTIDGDILVRTAYDCDTSCSYLEFYEKTGYDEEAFPWTYLCESDRVFDDDLEDVDEDVLVDLYCEAVMNM